MRPLSTAACEFCKVDSGLAEEQVAEKVLELRKPGHKYTTC